MSSSLFGIFNSQRALQLNQAAINLINNNIANINTPGYSKQRLELSQITLASGNTGLSMTQAGAGAQIDSVSRNRDLYLDSYYRKENSNLSYYTELTESAQLVEDITNELSDNGIGNVLNEFYDAAQQLSINPTDEVTRTNFVQRAIDVCTKFNQVSEQLNDFRASLVGDVSKPGSLLDSKINLSVNDLNTKLQQLADINKTISVTTADGITPNSLLDERDRILDDISGYIPITVTQGQNNLVTISLNGTDLVNGADKQGSFNIAANDADNPVVVKFKKNDGTTVTPSITAGKIAAILDLGGSDSSKLTIKGILDKLDILANEFATQLNSIQKFSSVDSLDPTKVTSSMAMDKSSKTLTASTHSLFLNQDNELTASDALISAGNIRVNQKIIDNVFEIAAARITYLTTDPASTATGDGSNALNMSQFRNISTDALGNLTTEKFMSSTVGEIGTKISSIEDNMDSHTAIVDQIVSRRESAMGVNLDEELTDLVKYQRAYEASAKILSAIDKMLQQIINVAG